MPDLLERLKSALADRYAVESEIGRGGMATVFLAEDLKHHRKVAIKVLHPELTATLGGERFLHEIEIIAGLQHPHILPLYDSGEADGLLYYVMPYARGESLRQRLDRDRQLAVDESVRIAVEVADGLDYAHRQGVVHRDIKPGNILLAEGHATIADFGIARAIEAARADRVTSTGLGVGTPLYASPEQATGEETLDGRTDIYSLGCVLYEMLAAEPPLTGSTPKMIQARRLSETPTALHDLRETVPPALDQVIARALARVPADRYATASQFAQALQASLLGSTPALEAGATATHTRAGGSAPTARWRGAVMGLVAIAAIAVVWLVAAGRPEPREARLLPAGPDLGDHSVAVLPFTNIMGVDSLEDIGPGLASLLATNLAQMEAVRVVGAERLLDLMRQAGSDETDRIPDELALNIASASGARLVVQASFASDGPELRLDARLIDLRDGTTISAEEAQGSNVLRLVDQLSAGLLSGVLGETVAPTELTPVGQLTTVIFEAYREYQAGLLAARRHLSREAVEHYERAVELDSTFALAWLELGINAIQSGTEAPARSYLERAERYSARVSERDRLTIRAGLAEVAGNIDLWVNTLEELIAKYPDDKLARVKLSGIYEDRGRTEAARRQLEQVLALDLYYAAAVNKLSVLEARAGNEAKADSLSLRYIELEPDQPNSYDTRGEVLAMFGRDDEARAAFREAIRLDPGFFRAYLKLGDLALQEGDPFGARSVLQPYWDTNDPTVAVRLLFFYAETYVAEGRYRDALDAYRESIEKAIELGSSRMWQAAAINAFYAQATGEYEEAERVWRGLLSIDFWKPWAVCGTLSALGRQEQFEEMGRFRDSVATDLDADPGYTGRRGMVPFADGLIAWYRDRDAVEVVRFFREGRAEAGIKEGKGFYDCTTMDAEEILALIEAGRAADALRIVDDLASDPRPNLNHLAWYLRGRAYEALGDSGQALEDYQRLLDVAGEGIQEIVLFRDTPERAARLKGGA